MAAPCNYKTFHFRELPHATRALDDGDRLIERYGDISYVTREV